MQQAQGHFGGLSAFSHKQFSIKGHSDNAKPDREFIRKPEVYLA
ncbi:hypothetical protein [Alteromonas sp. H39]